VEDRLGLYHVIYESKGYWFRTPEAWISRGISAPACTCAHCYLGSRNDAAQNKISPMNSVMRYHAGL